MKEELDSGAIDFINEAYQQNYGPGIALIKKRVGIGQIFSNDTTTAVVSNHGFWVQCNGLPAEFSGATDIPYTCRFITETDSLALINSLRDLAINDKNQSFSLNDFIAIYNSDGIGSLEHSYFRRITHDIRGPRTWPQEEGEFLGNSVPEYFCSRMHFHENTSTIDESRTTILIRQPGDVNLLIEFRHSQGNSIDLNVLGVPSAVN